MPKQIKPVSIIIPTYNAPDMVAQCVHSILQTQLMYPVEVIIVNNGHPQSLDNIGESESVRVVQTGGQNLGWEGGLKEGLKHTDSEFVCFMNDDTFVPPSENFWMRRMIETFSHTEVGAVGPVSNIVMGAQNMTFRTPHNSIETTYLIGLCFLTRRSILDQVGGVDDTLPGGDDLDLSIRIRKAGYSLVNRRDVYVHHHGFQTGQRVYGGPTTRNGWNSRDRTERTNMALIKKHGFTEWFKCIAGYEYPAHRSIDDHEGDIIRQHTVGEKVVDLGCAYNKTVPTALGVDIIPKGERVPFLSGRSEADVVADVEKTLPFADETQDTVVARHVLEHCLDTVSTLNEWKRVVKHGGRIIVAVPNEDVMHTIPLNGEHVHAFNPSSLSRIGTILGLKPIHVEQTRSASFVAVFERNGHEN